MCPRAAAAEHHLPVPGLNLFDLTRLRLVAERAGVKSVDIVEARLQVRFVENPAVDPRRLVDLVARRSTRRLVLLHPRAGLHLDRIELETELQLGAAATAGQLEA